MVKFVCTNESKEEIPLGESLRGFEPPIQKKNCAFVCCRLRTISDLLSCYDICSIVGSETGVVGDEVMVTCRVMSGRRPKGTELKGHHLYACL